MDGPGGLGNTSEYSITLDSINKLADDYTKIKEELLADLEDDESVKSDLSEKDFVFSVDSSSSGRNRDLINSAKLHDLLVSGPSLQDIRRPKRITQVAENYSIQIHSPCTTPTQGRRMYTVHELSKSMYSKLYVACLYITAFCTKLYTLYS